MNWLFWVLLIVGLLLLLWPAFAVVTAVVRVALWLIGALLIIGAIIWAVNATSRAATRVNM